MTSELVWRDRCFPSIDDQDSACIFLPRGVEEASITFRLPRCVVLGIEVEPRQPMVAPGFFFVTCSIMGAAKPDASLVPIVQVALEACPYRFPRVWKVEQDETLARISIGGEARIDRPHLRFRAFVRVAVQEEGV